MARPARGVREDEWLYLFMSSIRELYAEDALGALAAPVGAHLRFRYQEKYVAEGARRRWRDGSWAGHRLVALFSLQHEHKFYDAVFLPLRSGTVVRTFVEADIYVIELEVADYLPLESPAGEAGGHAEIVKNFSNGLTALLQNNDPRADISAAVGPEPLALLLAADQDSAAFVRTVDYLAAMMPDRAWAYWRVLAIRLKHEKIAIKDGRVEFIGGERYALELLHYNPEVAANSPSIQLTEPAGLKVIGESSYPIRSRYNVVVFPLYAPPCDTKADGELKITTGDGTAGPTVRIPSTVRPARTDGPPGAILGIGGGIAIAIPAALTLGSYRPLGVALAAVGTALAGIGLWWRRFRGLPN